MKLLQPFREIAGVDGSFLVGRDGFVFERDLAAFIPDDVLAAVALRADRLFEAAEDGAEPVEEVLLQLAGSCLLVRRTEVGYLGVLGQPRLNVEALRIAANLLRKRLAAPSQRQGDPSSGMAGLTPPPVPVFPSSSMRMSAGSPAASSAAPVRSGPAPTTRTPERAAPAPAAKPAAKKPKPKIWG